MNLNELGTIKTKSKQKSGWSEAIINQGMFFEGGKTYLYFAADSCGHQ